MDSVRAVTASPIGPPVPAHLHRPTHTGGLSFLFKKKPYYETNAFVPWEFSRCGPVELSQGLLKVQSKPH